MDKRIQKVLTQKNFAFKYDGKESVCFTPKVEFKTVRNTADEREIRVRYIYDFGVAAEKKIIYYKRLDSVYERFSLENLTDEITEKFSDIRDFCHEFAFDPPTESGIGDMLKEDNVRLFSYMGSVLRHDEFLPAYQYLYKNYSEDITNGTGRSSDSRMPYFNINRLDEGVVVAIGWSGCWKASVKRTEKGVLFTSGVAGAEFFLEPRERVELTSVLITGYDDGYQDGQNRFRNVMKRRAAEIGHIKGPEDLPFSILLWGAMPSDKQIALIEKVTDAGIPINYVWMDAGWYGYSTGRCINEHEGDWGAHTGSWVVNKNYHPDGLLDVSRTIKERGFKYLLWFEPERVIKGTDVTKHHPDWFFKREDTTWLINYGNEEALQGTFEMLSNYIETLGLSCYRQDFNVDPLPYWNKADETGRAGITQIKHINGLYRLWDMLLERFPHLTIDNCASGGRRLDFELMSRSLSVTRSDYQCGFDPDEMSFQNHTMGSLALLPYLGTYAGYPGWEMTKYSVRSCYAPTFSFKTFCYENWSEHPQEEIDNVKKFAEEYVSLKPYFVADFYNLNMPWVTEGAWGIVSGNRTTPDETVWCAMQFNRKEEGDGIILAFRRERSPYSTADFILHGLDKDKTYELTDVDTGKVETISGEELAEKGYTVEIREKKDCRLIKYRAI
ncbi:MAG: alpha-galactosidase [Clostridia bacterium]|nr:alpha-galactosidase [Clostridia bacterium]